MKSISMLEFRKDAENVIEQVRRGQRMILTYRGQPVMRLEPLRDAPAGEDDPFYGLDRLGDATGKTLTNQEMDDIIYGT